MHNCCLLLRRSTMVPYQMVHPVYVIHIFHPIHYGLSAISFLYSCPVSEVMAKVLTFFYVASVIVVLKSHL